MQKNKVALDVDGVLANFYLAMCRRFDKKYVMTERWGVHWFEESLIQVDEDMEFWDSLPNMNYPEAITFDFDYYITAIPDKYSDSRFAWLKRNGYPDKPVIFAFNKAEAMKEKGVGILIDDKYENIEGVEAAGLIGIHYVPNYLTPIKEQTHHIERTIKHLSEATAIIDRINKTEISSLKHINHTDV